MTIGLSLDRSRKIARVALAALVALLAAPPLARGGQALQEIEKEFKASIDKMTAATVSCIATAASGEQASRSSGVIVSRRGLVLSDGDVGAVASRGPDNKVAVRREEVVEVRVPNLKQGTFTPYSAKVVLRLRDLDTTLLRITNPPQSGFATWLVPGTSDGLRVGDFTFVMGNSFNLSDELPPSLTAGIVSSIAPLPEKDATGPGGRFEWIFTSAAVNPGVNGGPMVDVEGRLVATVSSRVPPNDPLQFLGKAVPMDRIRAAFAHLPESAEVFPELRAFRERSRAASALEMTLHAAAMRAHPAVLSLEVARSEPISNVAARNADPVRSTGPVSAVMVDAEGWIVTSLYNLTSIATLETPEVLWNPKRGVPPLATVEYGLSKITEVKAHLPDGRTFPARVVGHDPKIGVALLRAEVPAAATAEPAYALPTLEPAPADTFREGRFVVAVGNPFGATRRPDPLVTFGILSKHHAPDDNTPWRGQWQTDAGAIDGNVGGAVVDLRGRLVGLLTIWSPGLHGRNSGLAFVVPWSTVLASLPDMKAGKTWKRGFLGVQWKGQSPLGEARIDQVVPDSAAARVGLEPGDVLVAIGDTPISVLAEAQQRIPFYWEGDRITVTVRRGDKERTLELTLGARPDPPPK